MQHRCSSMIHDNNYCLGNKNKILKAFNVSKKDFVMVSHKESYYLPRFANSDNPPDLHSERISIRPFRLDKK